MRCRNDIPEEIKRRVPINKVLNQYGYEVNRGGFIACPFHSEKTPSLKIYPESNSYYCFGCGFGGDVISFVMHLFNLDFGSAIMRLDNDFGLGLSRPLTVRERAEFRKKSAELDAEKQREEIRYIAYCLHYNAVSAKFRYHWTNFLTLRPNVPNDPLNPLFADALNNLEFLEYWLQKMTFEKWKEVYY